MLAAVVAVFGKARFQVARLFEQRGNLLTLLADPGFELGDAFVWRHASVLHVLRESA